MSKDMLFSNDARWKLMVWIEKVAKAVIVTMWPKWRNVILEKEWRSPLITNDWVTIAEYISLEDKHENMWASLVIEAASRTNSLAWDWTTTSTLLTYALAREWMKYIKNWVNAIELKKWMDIAFGLIDQKLNELTRDINWKSEISQVAWISAQDSVVWEIIAEAMEKVWKNWVISVEEWSSLWIELEVTQWMEIDTWYISPYMINDDEKMLSVYSDIWVLITDQKIKSTKSIIPILEKVIQAWQKKLVIIADDFEWDTVTWLVLNKMKWIIDILAVKSPGYWDRKKDLLKDIEILTWANIITDNLWMKLENSNLSDLWSIWKIISSSKSTILMGWWWKKEHIESRAEEIIKAIESTDSNFEKEKLAERLAKLDWWVAVIKVWAASEVEMKDKKLRIEDALNATKAAVIEWIIPGWWFTLLHISKSLDWVKLTNTDQNIWLDIVKKALFYPASQILENAWIDSSIVVDKVISSNDISFWYDSLTDSYVNLYEKWIIDPKMVSRIALQESISLAWMFLTTEVAIVSPEKKECDLSQNQNLWNVWNLWWMWMY